MGFHRLAFFVLAATPLLFSASAEASSVTLNCSGKWVRTQPNVTGEPVQGMALIVDFDQKEIRGSYGSFNITSVTHSIVFFERPYSENGKPGKMYGWISNFRRNGVSWFAKGGDRLFHRLPTELQIRPSRPSLMSMVMRISAIASNIAKLPTLLGKGADSALIGELRRCAAHAFVGSTCGNVKTHSARTILIQEKATGLEVEGDGAVKFLIKISGGVTAQRNLA